MESLVRKKDELKQAIRRAKQEGAPSEQIAPLYDAYLDVKKQMAAAEAQGQARKDARAERKATVARLEAKKQRLKDKVRELRGVGAPAHQVQPVYDAYLKVKQQIASLQGQSGLHRQASSLPAVAASAKGDGRVSSGTEGGMVGDVVKMGVSRSPKKARARGGGEALGAVGRDWAGDVEPVARVCHRYRLDTTRGVWSVKENAYGDPAKAMVFQEANDGTCSLVMDGMELAYTRGETVADMFGLNLMTVGVVTDVDGEEHAGEAVTMGLLERRGLWVTVDGELFKVKSTEAVSRARPRVTIGMDGETMVMEGEMRAADTIVFGPSWNASSDAFEAVWKGRRVGFDVEAPVVVWAKEHGLPLEAAFDEKGSAVPLDGGTSVGRLAETAWCVVVAGELLRVISNMDARAQRLAAGVGVLGKKQRQHVSRTADVHMCAGRRLSLWQWDQVFIKVRSRTGMLMVFPDREAFDPMLAIPCDQMAAVEAATQGDVADAKARAKCLVVVSAGVDRVPPRLIFMFGSEGECGAWREVLAAVRGGHGREIKVTPIGSRPAAAAAAGETAAAAAAVVVGDAQRPGGTGTSEDLQQQREEEREEETCVVCGVATEAELECGHGLMCAGCQALPQVACVVCARERKEQVAALPLECQACSQQQPKRRLRLLECAHGFLCHGCYALPQVTCVVCARERKNHVASLPLECQACMQQQPKRRLRLLECAHGYLCQGCHALPQVPKNIVVSGDGEVYITDYGMQDQKNLGTMTQTASATYEAPECLRGEPKSYASDVYSLATVLFEVFGNELYPRGRNSLETAMRLLMGNVPEIPPTVADNERALITACWQDNPSARPSIDDVLDSLQRH